MKLQSVAFTLYVHYKYIKAKISPGIHYWMFFAQKVENRRFSSRLISSFIKKYLQQTAHLANNSKVGPTLLNLQPKSTPQQICPHHRVCIYK